MPPGCLLARGRHTFPCVPPLLEDLDTLPFVVTVAGGLGAEAQLPASQSLIYPRKEPDPPLAGGTQFSQGLLSILGCKPNMGCQLPPCSVRCQQAEPRCVHTLSLRAVLPDGDVFPELEPKW